MFGPKVEKVIFGPKLEIKCGGYSKMEEYSKKVQPIAVPVWLIMKPAISPPFIVTPKRRKKTNPLPHLTQKMKAESS